MALIHFVEVVVNICRRKGGGGLESCVTGGGGVWNLTILQL
jgi:hypothetical protein